MIVDFSKSQTRLNLIKAFAGESQGRMGYNMAASFAGKKDLYVVKKLFLEIAEQEKEHAEVFCDFLKPFSGENIKFNAESQVYLFDSVLDYLKQAIANEMNEYDNGYKISSQIAMEEGFPDIAQKFSKIADIEKAHAERFKKMANLLETNELFNSKTGNGRWVCSQCGNVYEGSSVPDKCPVCGHSRGFFIKSDLCL